MAGTLSQALAGATLEALIQAYDDYKSTAASSFTPTPPPGYTSYVFRFYGWEGIETKAMVKYGLIFQSAADSGAYLIAFRGTEDDVEWIEDFDFSLTPFPGAAVEVSSGFLDAYVQGPATTTAFPSMREQILQWIAQTKPTSLTITGHSLGSSLASLCAYDLSLSVRTPVTFVSYASPNVGTSAWQAAFNAAYPDAIRVYNTEDAIPYAPPNDIWGYLPVGNDWAVEFEPYYLWDRVDPDALGTNHSCLNYQHVVNLAVVNSPPVFSGYFEDLSGKGWLMRSSAPSAERGKLRLQVLDAYLKGLKAIPQRPA